ncbi:MAG: glycosyl hydrolase family 95 catalytic domain-containing protein [Armatimonadota bacterium]
MPETRHPEAQICEIPYVRTKPWIDGQLDDAVWKEALRLGALLDISAYLEHRYHKNGGTPRGFGAEPAPGPAQPGTRVLACHDDDFLYLAFICEDPEPAEIRRRDRPFSSGVNREDCVYVWLDPAMQHLEPYACEYIVNAAGQKSEFYQGKYSGDYASLMAWEGRVTLNEQGWVAELQLPLERLGIDRACGFNVGRGYRGDWRTHALFTPDGEFKAGWGFAVLLGQGRAPGIALVQEKLAAIHRRLEGTALPSNPGSPREAAVHQDANAMIGISVWGPDYQPTVSVGRSDCYDRRWFGNDLPTVTRAEVIAAAQSGDPAQLEALRRRANDRQYGAYQQFPAPKTVGQIILQLPGGAEAEWRTDAAHGEDGAVLLDCRTASAELTLKIYVHKRRKLIVVDGTQRGLTGQSFGLSLYRHQDNPPPQPLPGYDYEADVKAGKNVGPLQPPEVGRQDDMIWLRQRLPADLTFPEGFEVLIAEDAGPAADGIELIVNRQGLGTPAQSQYEGWVDPMTTQNWGATQFRRMNATPGSAAMRVVRLQDETFRALFAVVSTNDGADTLRAGAQVLDEARKLSPDALAADSRAATPRERVGDYQYKQDLAMSSVFSAKFCFSDATAWHGDNHFNELLGTKNYGRYFIEGHLEELDSYFQMVEANLPAARALAREAFGCRGIAFGVASFPARFARLPMTSLDWDYSIECTGLVVQAFWLQYQYTLDREFLRRAYPIMKEAALFYADYAVLEEDGCYHLWPTTSSEHLMLQPYLRYNRDATAALSLACYCLDAAIEGARTLGCDGELVEEWQRTLDGLAPYPTEMTPDGPRFVDVAGARLMTEYNIFQPLSPIFFGGDIGLASPPETLAIARRTLAGLVRLSTTHWGHVYHAMIRLGQHPGGPIESQNLLQSHQGPIFLFPAVPEGYTGSFTDYRARGAFRVSAAMDAGRIISARVTSEAGGICRIALAPFSQTPRVRCMDDGKVQETELDARYVSFQTEVGKRYDLIPPDESGG